MKLVALAATALFILPTQIPPYGRDAFGSGWSDADGLTRDALSERVIP